MGLSVIRVAIISAAIGQISFKFELLLALGHTPRCFWIFEKKYIFKFFHEFLALLDYVRRYHEIKICSNFNCYFPSAIPPDFFGLLNKKCIFDFLPVFVVFVNIIGTLWEAKFQNAACPANRSRKFSKFSGIFFAVVLTKLCLGFWKLKL